MKRTAFVFPDQDVLKVGTGKDLCMNFKTANSLFYEADQETGKKLTRLCFEGPQEELNAQENQKAALVTCELAGLASILEIAPYVMEDVAYVIGYGVGFYPALAAAGTMDLSWSIRLAFLHSQKEVSSSWEDVLSNIHLSAPDIPILGCQSAELLKTPEDVRKELSAELFKSHQQCQKMIRFLKQEGVDLIVQFGADDDLGFWTKEVDPSIEVVTLHDERAVRVFADYFMQIRSL